jgi:large conductance mechanosensitive channel
MSMMKEFRDFALKGNVLDMAVGIIIGAAFGTIVTSLVSDIVMPPVGLLLGGVDFSDKFMLLKEGTTGAPYATLAQASEAGAVTLNYGVFFNHVVSFLIVALAVFMVVRSFNRMRKQFEKEQAPAASPGPSAEEKLLGEIRDLLAARS